MGNILVLGYFGYNSNRLDGQTVKTRELYNLIKSQGSDVDFYDTEDFRYSKLSIFRMFYKILKSKILVYLPAQNNLKTIFPCVYCLAFFFRFRILYFVVGGWLCDFIKSLPIHRKMLARIDGIYVETETLLMRLTEECGFENVAIFPNFRSFEYQEERIKEIANKITPEINTPLKIVFVSRVEKSKGLDNIKNVSALLEDNGYGNKVRFYFYGQKNDDYFDENLKDKEMFTYMGVLQPEHVLSTLEKYDVLIFPTHYEGEGCPGILVEALSVGLPIIASDWKYNGEFVENGVNGFLCETFSGLEYYRAISSLVDNRSLINVMGAESYKKSKQFSLNVAKNNIRQILYKE